MSTLALTNVYLERQQRSALEHSAKEHRSNLSVEVRKAIDVYISGISREDLVLLDTLSQRVAADIRVMNDTLDLGLARADRFFAEMAALRAA